MSELRTLLIEIGTEDLPSGLVVDGHLKFEEELHLQLKNRNFLGPDSPSAHFCTPRRIAVKIENVASRQPMKEVKRKGPPVTEIDENNPAVKGFAKSCGVAPDQLEICDGRLLCRVEEGRRTLEDVLPECWMLLALGCERLMRWGAGEHAFARPVRWLCVLHGTETVACELYGVKSGRITYGHRHHCSRPVELESADDYEEALKKACVIVDFKKRREVIESRVKEAKTELLDEAAATTEWPQVLAARLDEAFLKLPKEVIMQTLEHTLKVFPKKDGQKLLPEFFIVADVESKNPQVIVRGYENIARARLKDAEFFLDQDKKTPLENREAMLKRTLFQEKLGTLADKSERLVKLVEFLAPHCKASSEHARRAARLCKCDLGTDLVGEYPALQGIIGGYYAGADGEHKAVAFAIRDHYLPRGHLGRMPETPEGTVLALADKADTLAGFWSIGVTPSSSKDPYGLDRAAADILRILIEKKVDLDVGALVKQALSSYSDVGDGIYDDLHFYMREHLRSDVFVRSFKRYRDTTPGCVNAVKIVSKVDLLLPYDFFSRVEAVDSFAKHDPAADSLIAANKRIRNILKKFDGKIPEFDAGLMTKDAERALSEAVDAHRKEFDLQLNARYYPGAMRTLANLREPVDQFFDDVLVMSENKAERDNRLALLETIRTMFLKIADFSKLNPSRSEAKE